MEKRKILIVGGGSSGWLTASILQKSLNQNGNLCEISVIDPSSIGRIGVGESTVPSLLYVLSNLGINEFDFMQKCDGAYKHGILFDNWRSEKNSPNQYFHAFEAPIDKFVNSRFQSHLIDESVDFDISKRWFYSYSNKHHEIPYDEYVNFQKSLALNYFAPKSIDQPDYHQGGITYAYQIDASKFADYLRDLSCSRGVNLVQKAVKQAALDSAGNIERIILEDDSELTADLYIDCTGFRALLIGETLNSDFHSFEDYLLCNRALALQTPLNGPGPRPYTTAYAEAAGWIWDIDLSTRRGSGYVYSSNHTTEEEAERTLCKYLNIDPGGHEFNRISFRTGFRPKSWNRNCVAIGLSSGFIEPLESTGIYLIEEFARLLAELLEPGFDIEAAARKFNSELSTHYHDLRDFIVLHYCLTDRSDTSFWREVATRKRIPKELQDKIEQWKGRFTARFDFGSNGLFGKPNYDSILYGMGFLQNSSSATNPLRETDFTRTLSKITSQELVGRLDKHKSILDKINQPYADGKLSAEPGLVFYSEFKRNLYPAFSESIRTQELALEDSCGKQKYSGLLGEYKAGLHDIYLGSISADPMFERIRIGAEEMVLPKPGNKLINPSNHAFKELGGLFNSLLAGFYQVTSSTIYSLNSEPVKRSQLLKFGKNLAIINICQSPVLIEMPFTVKSVTGSDAQTVDVITGKTLLLAVPNRYSFLTLALRPGDLIFSSSSKFEFSLNGTNQNSFILLLVF